MALQDIANSFAELQKRISTEGITDNSGNVLVSPSVGIGQLKFPEQRLGVPDISSSLGTQASTNAQIENFIKMQAEQAEARKKEAEEVQKEKPKSWFDFLSANKQQTPEDFRTGQYSELGYDAKEYFADLKARTDEIDALNKDYNNTLAMVEKQKADIIGRPGQGMDYLNNQLAQIDRNANVILNQKAGNINIKTASLEAKRQNWGEVTNYIDKAVNNYTAGLQAEFQMTMDFYNENSELIKSLGKEYDNAINNYINTVQNNLNNARQEKADVLSLMVNNPQAGITADDTVETASQKIARSGGTASYQLQLRQENRLGRESTTGTGLSASLQSDYAEDLAYIDSLTGDEQTKWLTQNKRALIAKYGEANYNKMLPQAVTPEISTPTNITAPVFGTGIFANISLDEEIKRKQEQNKKMGVGKNVGIREELVRQGGYDVREVDRRLNPIGTALTDAGNWFVNLFNF